MKELSILLGFICLFFCSLFALSGLHAASSSTELSPKIANAKQLRCYNSYDSKSWMPLWDNNSTMRYMPLQCGSNQVNTACDRPGYIAVGFVYDSGGLWGVPTCKLQCASTNTTANICDWK